MDVWEMAIANDQCALLSIELIICLVKEDFVYKMIGFITAMKWLIVSIHMHVYCLIKIEQIRHVWKNVNIHDCRKYGGNKILDINAYFNTSFPLLDN